MRGTFTDLQYRVIMFVQVAMVALFVSAALLGLHRFAQIHGAVEWPEIDIIHQQRRDIRALEARIDQLHRIIGGPFEEAPFEPMPGDITPDRSGETPEETNARRQLNDLRIRMGKPTVD